MFVSFGLKLNNNFHSVMAKRKHCLYYGRAKFYLIMAEFLCYLIMAEKTLTHYGREKLYLIMAEREQ